MAEFYSWERGREKEGGIKRRFGKAALKAMPLRHIKMQRMEKSLGETFGSLLRGKIWKPVPLFGS